MKNNLSAARRNAFMHILPDAVKVKNSDKDLSKKRVIRLYDVVIEKECKNNFDLADSDLTIFDLADFQLPGFSHGCKNHITIWQD
mgnify:CR=1 FL=1